MYLVLSESILFAIEVLYSTVVVVKRFEAGDTPVQYQNKVPVASKNRRVESQRTLIELQTPRGTQPFLTSSYSLSLLSLESGYFSAPPPSLQKKERKEESATNTIFISLHFVGGAAERRGFPTAITPLIGICSD
ncbi:hypothetical protein TNCV_4414721 [Trichonephila clavipes]|uniref:Uncharacterized protein n=1 Tax=Trichonephila clavipes TaxID=2585209 RepID=A0A8X6V9I9_TRICX|nr:hypothetical protein TNCV_4414721 [Trichonephila clavipes]